jgi:hypothetical protein
VVRAREGRFHPRESRTSRGSWLGHAMAALSTVGALVRVTPWDDLRNWASPDPEWELVDVDGPQRYRDLLCSIIVRNDGSDWRVETRSSAGFKVGPSIVLLRHGRCSRITGRRYW